MKNQDKPRVTVELANGGTHVRMETSTYNAMMKAIKDLQETLEEQAELYAKLVGIYTSLKSSVSGMEQVSPTIVDVPSGTPAAASATATVVTTAVEPSKEAISAAIAAGTLTQDDIVWETEAGLVPEDDDQTRYPDNDIRIGHKRTVITSMLNRRGACVIDAEMLMWDSDHFFIDHYSSHKKQAEELGRLYDYYEAVRKANPHLPSLPMVYDSKTTKDGFYKVTKLRGQPQTHELHAKYSELESGQPLIVFALRQKDDLRKYLPSGYKFEYNGCGWSKDRWDRIIANPKIPSELKFEALCEEGIYARKD